MRRRPPPVLSLSGRGARPGTGSTFRQRLARRPAQFAFAIVRPSRGGIRPAPARLCVLWERPENLAAVEMTLANRTSAVGLLAPSVGLITLFVVVPVALT